MGTVLADHRLWQLAVNFGLMRGTEVICGGGDRQKQALEYSLRGITVHQDQPL